MAFKGDINFIKYGIDFEYDDSITMLPDNIRIIDAISTNTYGRISIAFKNLAGQGPGNEKWASQKNYRALVKPFKSTMFKTNPDPEKKSRNKKGGRRRRTQRRNNHL